MIDNNCNHAKVCQYSGYASEDCAKCQFREHTEEKVVGICIEHPWAEEENGLLISEFECPFCHSWHKEAAVDTYCTHCGKSIKIVHNKR